MARWPQYKAGLVCPSENCRYPLSNRLRLRTGYYARLRGHQRLNALAARQAFLDKNRAALGDFFEDMLASFRWFHDPKNRDEAIAIVSRVTKQPAESLSNYLWTDKDFYYDRDCMPDLNALQSNVSALRQPTCASR